MKVIAVLSVTHTVVILFGSFVYSQDDTTLKAGKDAKFSELFIEAGYHVEFKNYEMAVAVYLKLETRKKNNANIQYKIGLCYLEMGTEAEKAIPYLKQAIKSISRNYDDLAYIEKKAPVKAYFDLGRAYHLTDKPDKAIEYYELYAGNLNKKHFMQEEVARHIAICNYAKLQMENRINVNITNMGKGINTIYSDFGPFLNADGSILIFSSNKKGGTGNETGMDGKYFEDIYISHKKDDGTWNDPEKISSSINTFYNDAAVWLSTDGQQLLIYKDEEGDGNIYQSFLLGETWTVPDKVINNINSIAWESHACISPDGNIFYFTSDRKGGYGGMDIYRCNKLPNGEWALAENLGPNINTKYDEESPFIHANGNLLFFSSKGHQTMGGYDIFFTEQSDSGQWSPPINIGYPINSTADDAYYALSTDGKHAYFSSLANSGLGGADIYSVEFKDYEEIALTVLSGKITIMDEEGLPYDAQIIVSDNGSPDAQSQIYKPNSSTGKYIIVLNPGKDYNISYFINDSLVHTENVFIPEESAYQEIEKSIDLKTLNIQEKPIKDSTVKNIKQKEGKKLTNTDIPAYQEFFNYNIKELDTSSAGFNEFINKVIEFVRQNGHVNITIEASVSKVPSKTYGSNEVLVKDRAENAAYTLINLLNAKGIDENMVTVSKKSFVQGPDYKDDAEENREIYEKYQYVIIGVR